jgi:hypothetical protein
MHPRNTAGLLRLDVLARHRLLAAAALALDTREWQRSL